MYIRNTVCPKQILHLIQYLTGIFGLPGRQVKGLQNGRLKRLASFHRHLSFPAVSPVLTVGTPHQLRLKVMHRALKAPDAGKPFAMEPPSFEK